MEMTTPTGAAILRALAPAFVPLPPMRLEKTAFGAGGREIPGRTNCLRLLIGEPLEGADNQAGLESARMCLLTTEIDDMNPELYGPLLDRLFAAKARDASLVPIVMKKGRPGVSVRVLCDETRRGALLEILLRHTTTFGVKTAWVERHCLRREVKEMATPYGPIRVKIGYWGDQAIKAAPEFEDCRRAAETTGAPIGDVYRSAERSYENARDEA
ncbi:MAG: hypothetical protein BWZ10_02937 [candidate division BRC1 bacterium ADurb.BinA364]|nr:MAG: hypothetical protein BWZ10_02937 [candidate division BRC1 bacterium ADurb.BinA364]